ncbi:hypothetical protein HNY73_015389 [Argiope bruennichi]|uniref:Uncharacterized protein n=1 Tax=Argiope bruennichi TaxID=94029 RepID=A0A8T0EXC9_ARGBR|nr:hypothetical protein HNY73_015389 [Argiope bruennichi]
MKSKEPSRVSGSPGVAKTGRETNFKEWDRLKGRHVAVNDIGYYTRSKNGFLTAMRVPPPGKENEVTMHSFTPGNTLTCLLNRRSI